MIVTTLEGKKLNIHVGGPLTGVALKEVTLTAEDFYDPRFDDWMKAVLMTRFLPPKEKINPPNDQIHRNCEAVSGAMTS